MKSQNINYLKINKEGQRPHKVKKNQKNQTHLKHLKVITHDLKNNINKIIIAKDRNNNLI